MIHAQNTKKVLLSAPDVLDNESATAAALDTHGFDYLEVDAAVGVTDIAMSALKLQGCDTVDGSYVDIPGAVIDPLPSETDDGKLYGFYVSLIAKPRFIKLVATAGDGATGVYFAAVATLSRARVTPTDAASRGLAGQAIVV